ncbi:hypothetical protein AgCh_030787 [Apium graveolens]
MARLQQTQRKSVGSAPRLPVEIIAAIAAETIFGFYNIQIDFIQLSSIDASRTTWKIKDRVTRMWPSISVADNGTETMKGYNLVLLDDDDCHVHIFVYADNWKYHVNKIVEARNKFEFVDLSDLFVVTDAYEKPDSPDYSTDVIGILVDFEHVWKIKTIYGLKDICKFRITDGRDSHKVTVWGNLAVTTDARVKEVKAGFKYGEEEPIIFIASSTKLKIWKSSVQISTLSASKIYINLDHDFVFAMRQGLREEGYVPSDKTTSSPTTTDVKEVVPIIETVTLKELSEKTSTDFLKDPASYPPPLKQIAGREITVKVELTDDNILVSSTVYYAHDAYECSVSTSPVLEDIDTGTSVSNYTNISVPSPSDGAGTPGSALSTSKRVKKDLKVMVEASAVKMKFMGMQLQTLEWRHEQP